MCAVGARKKKVGGLYWGFMAAGSAAARMVREAKAVEAIEEANRRAGMLIHQNTGRWDMTVEHDIRTYNVTASNMRILDNALQSLRAITQP